MATRPIAVMRYVQFKERTFDLQRGLDYHYIPLSIYLRLLLYIDHRSSFRKGYYPIAHSRILEPLAVVGPPRAGKDSSPY